MTTTAAYDALRLERPTECIRRPHAVWTTCKCDTCRTAMRRQSKLARHGYWTRVSADEANTATRRLMARGWTNRALASATGISEDTVGQAMRALRAGRDYQWGAVHAKSVVNHGAPTDGQIGAIGVRRRLRALAALGWSLEHLEPEVGLGWTTLAAVRNGQTERANVRIAAPIIAAYDRLCMTPGPSEAAKLHASKQKWVPPLAWDDIDDPAAKPDLGKRPVGGQGRSIEDLEHLLRWQVWTWPGITARLGISKSAIEHMCARNDRMDLLREIQLNTPTHRPTHREKAAA